MTRANQTLIVMPAYNEAALIGDTISSITLTTGLPVLVIDDASTDKTAELARQRGAKVITLASQLGAWGATQTGLRYAKRKGYGQVVTIDADGQHDATFIPTLLETMAERELDMVIGCCTDRGSSARKAAWVLMRLLSGLAIQDLTSGFRVYSSRSLEILVSRNATALDYQDIGVLCLLRHAGLKIAETDVCMFTRRDGKSRIFDSWFAVGKYMLYTSLLAISHSKLNKRK